MTKIAQRERTIMKTFTCYEQLDCSQIILRKIIHKSETASEAAASRHFGSTHEQSSSKVKANHWFYFIFLTEALHWSLLRAKSSSTGVLASFTWFDVTKTLIWKRDKSFSLFFLVAVGVADWFVTSARIPFPSEKKLAVYNYPADLSQRSRSLLPRQGFESVT